MTEPQTPEQESRAPDANRIEPHASTLKEVVRGVLEKHLPHLANGAFRAGRQHYRRICMECGHELPWLAYEEALRAHQAAEIVAALGLREEWGLSGRVSDLRPYYVSDRRLTDKDTSKSLDQVVYRNVTAWRPADGD